MTSRSPSLTTGFHAHIASYVDSADYVLFWGIGIAVFEDSCVIEELAICEVKDLSVIWSGATVVPIIAAYFNWA